MDLKRLRYFCAIVEQGSISKAAQVLCIAQPPLSRRLRELEEETGAELLLRGGRQVELTEAGHYLYARACEILRAAEEARQGTQRLASAEKRVLRIGLSSLYQRYFGPLIRRLHEENPRAEISVTAGDSSHLEQSLLRGRLDIALIQRPRESTRFTLHAFPPPALRAAVSRTLLAQPPAAPLPLAEAGRLPLIALRRVEGLGSFEAIAAQLRRQGVSPEVKMNVSDPAMALEMLESGLPALVFLPASECRPSADGQYHLLELSPAPAVFQPVAARTAQAAPLPELEQLLRAALLP